MDTGSPEDIAEAFAVKKTLISKEDIGYVAARGNGVENYGEKTVIGYAGSGDGVRIRIERTDVKKVLGSVRHMNTAGKAVVLDGERSYMQNKAAGEKTRVRYEGGQCIVCMWAFSKESRRRLSEAIGSRSWLRRVRVFSNGKCETRTSA